MNYQMALSQAALKEPFAAKDFRRFVKPAIGKPHDPNAWSAHWRTLIKIGWLVPSGEWRGAQDPKSNASPTFLYYWYRPKEIDRFNLIYKYLTLESISAETRAVLKKLYTAPYHPQWDWNHETWRWELPIVQTNPDPDEDYVDWGDLVYITPCKGRETGQLRHSARARP